MVENSIEEIYQERSKELVRFCETFLHNQMRSGVDAEDIVQRVVVTAWEKRNQLATHQNLWGWLLNACAKECAMHLRTESYRRKYTGWPVPLTDTIPMDEQQDILLRWLNQMDAQALLDELQKNLTPLEQAVYEQYYAQEKSAKAAADALNMKVNAVNDAARRIRKRAADLRGEIFIFILSPIFRLLCSIWGEGRPWR